MAPVQLDSERLSIGRLTGYNDIVLEDDPQFLVSRISHCAVERDNAGWWVADNASRNRTYIQRGESVEIVNGRASLSDGNTIRILARLPETDGVEPLYWSLVFHDPMRTRQVTEAPTIAFLEYDWIEARLYRIHGQDIREIHNLRPQEHVLIRYMDQLNRSNDYVAVMCTHDQLIEGVWGDDGYDHTEAEISRLVWSLRKKIEIDNSDPQILQTVKGLGYRLVTRPHS